MGQVESGDSPAETQIKPNKKHTKKTKQIMMNLNWSNQNQVRLIQIEFP